MQGILALRPGITPAPGLPCARGCSTAPKAPLCKGSWHGVAVTEGLLVQTMEIVSSRLSASRSHRRVTARTARRRGVPFTRVKGTKTRLGLRPKTPLTAKLRLDTNDVNIVRTAPRIRSQGACGAFYFGCSRGRIKITPYKRRLIPLREAVALAFRAGCTDASGVSGSSPSDFWLLFFTEK